MNNRPSHLNSAYKTELSPRQREVLDLVAQGNTYGETAETLGITLDGVKWHMREVLAKLGVNSREEAVEWWQQEHSISRGLARFGRALAPLLGMRALLAGGAAAALAGIAIGGTMLTGWHFGGSAPASAPVVDGGAPPACVFGLTKFQFSGGANADINNGDRVLLSLSSGPIASWDDNPTACSMSDRVTMELMVDGKPLDVLGNGIAFEFQTVFEPETIDLDGTSRTTLRTASSTYTPMLEWTNWCGDRVSSATVHVSAEHYPASDGLSSMPKCLDASQPSRLVVVQRPTWQLPADTSTPIFIRPDGTPTP